MKRKELALTLASTDIPDFPASPPYPAVVTVVDRAVHVEANRTGTVGELLGLSTDVHTSFEIKREDIKSVRVKILPDVSDDFESSRWNQLSCSQLAIQHKDPYEVVEEFTTIFESAKSYWIRALRKMLSEE